MKTINERMKELRKECKKNQEEWGGVLGIKRTAICDIESGRRNVTDRHILMLENYTEHPINIDWLRTGNGEMFKPLDREQEIAKITVDLFKEEENSFRYNLISAIASLDEKQLEVLESIVKKIATKKD